MNRLLFFICFVTFSVSGQNDDAKEFDLITDTEQAESFLKSSKSKHNKLITFNEEKHKTELTKALFQLPKGGTKTVKNDFEQTRYKVIEKNSVTSYRVSYIYLDGSKLSLKEIDDKRYEIRRKYKNGASFSLLAKQYSMDDNAKYGGDLGWFTKGITHPKFEKAITSDEFYLNDIFLIDIEDKKWYYVVLKTHAPKEINEIKVLKVVEPLK